MNPVFQREMRAQSRTTRPWRLRLWVAVAAMGGLAWLGWRSPEMFVGSGQPAFLALNLGAVGVLAVIGPLLTHDLLSRERREGTLGLLCSTPLTSREMVLGKVAAAVIQALGAWLAMAPLLLLPILQGGVSQAEMVATFALQGAVTVCGLGAGLASSAWNRQAGWSLVAAYALLGVVGISVMIPVGVVIAFMTGPPGAGGMYTLAAVLVVAATALTSGFYHLAAQEADHTWNRIQYLGETADETLMDLGVVSTTPTAEQAEPRSQSGERFSSLPSDAETLAPAACDMSSGNVPKPPGNGDWWAEWRRSKANRMRESDPWRWAVSRRRDPAWQVSWILLAAYLWWLGIGINRNPPTWPEWSIPLLLCLRLPRLLREERRNGMLEVLATCPNLSEFPGAICRMVWWEFGPATLLHVGLCLGAVGSGMADRLSWGLVPLLVASAAAPWIGLWVVTRVQNYFLGVVLVLLGLYKLGWLVGLATEACLHRYSLNSWEVGSTAWVAVTPLVQSAVQVALALWARRSVRARFRGGAILMSAGQ